MNSVNYKTDIQIVLDENQLLALCEMVGDSLRYRRGLPERFDILETAKIVRDARKQIN